MRTNLILESQVPLDESHTHIFWGKGDEVNYLVPGDTFKVKPIKIVEGGKVKSRNKRQHVYEFKVMDELVKMYETGNKDPRILPYYKDLPQEAKDKYEWTLKNAVSFQQGKPVPCRWHIQVKCISINGVLLNNRRRFW
jgi:hypothetical protein